MSIRRTLVLVLAAALLAVFPALQADAKRSGGYSHPSSSSHVSSGYSHSGSSFFSRSSTSSSSGDAAVSRSLSGGRGSSFPSSSSTGYGFGGTRGTATPSDNGWASRTFQDSSYRGDLVTWLAIDALLRDHQEGRLRDLSDTANFRQWRADTQATVSTDPLARDKLAEVDQALAAAPKEQGTPLIVWIIGFGVATAAGMIAYRLWRRHRRRFRAEDGIFMAPMVEAFPDPRLANPRWRAGQPIILDEAALALFGAGTKVLPPAAASGSLTLKVRSVSAVRIGDQPFTRIHLGNGFLQCFNGSLDADQDCRWFSRLDEIYPADDEEWDFWLADADGMIGFPSFQTKDGKLYDRQWLPGPTRIPPAFFEEGSRTGRCMLYAAPTGAPLPASQLEYILVSEVRDGDAAWVEIHAGIDIDPTAFGLARTEGYREAS